MWYANIYPHINGTFNNSMHVYGYAIKINSELNLSLLITLNGSQHSACRSLYKFFLVKESKVNA